MKIATATIVGPCQHKPAGERCVTCVLDASDYFSGLDLDAKRALQQVLAFKSFERRETLYAEGAASHHLYILISGKVKIYKSLSNGRQQIHKLGLAPGDLLACEDLFLESHTSSAEALDTTAVCYLKKSDLQALMQAHPQMRDTLLRTMARHLNAYIRHIANLGQKTALERVASYLLFFRDTHLSGALKQPVLTESLTRSEVADMLGVTQRTLIRGLKKLERDSVIALTREGFVIRQPAALARLSEDC
jgi:CRP-like cAMP-binding protein